MKKESSLEHREYGRRDPLRWPRGTLNPQKLALTLLGSGGHSVGIVRSLTQATEFSLICRKKQPWRNWNFLLGIYLVKGAME
jgi:hypothetical protein